MSAPIEAAGDKSRPLQPGAERIHSNPFSWSMTMNLPTLKQTRFWSVNRGLNELWMDTDHEVKNIRIHSP
jgi:hypothetical protein